MEREERALAVRVGGRGGCGRSDGLGRRRLQLATGERGAALAEQALQLKVDGGAEGIDHRAVAQRQIGVFRSAPAEDLRGVAELDAADSAVSNNWMVYFPCQSILNTVLFRQRIDRRRQ